MTVTKDHGRSPVGTALLGARFVWGAGLLLRPRTVLHAVGHSTPGDGDVLVARLLGGRHLLQGVVRAADSSPVVRRLAPVVDGLHAATAVALAATTPRWRNAALLDASLAGLFGATDGLT